MPASRGLRRRYRGARSIDQTLVGVGEIEHTQHRRARSHDAETPIDALRVQKRLKCARVKKRDTAQVDVDGLVVKRREPLLYVSHDLQGSFTAYRMSHV